MKLQDYIHYYIGVECLNTWFTPDHECYKEGWKLEGYRTTSQKCYFLENETDNTWTDSIKPILRRLISLTEDERADLHIGTCFDFGSYRPDQFNYLLKKHFDLFGLIDAGLAIDANQQP